MSGGDVFEILRGVAEIREPGTGERLGASALIYDACSNEFRYAHGVLTGTSFEILRSGDALEALFEGKL